jgi:tetratricopeptide (TPR) repeat protein
MAAAIALAAANAAFVDEEYETAIRDYGAAIAADPSNADAFSKRAAAQLKLRRYTEAVSDATASVKLSATPKAYARKGQASFALGEFEAARAAFCKALELISGAASSTELQRWVRKCDAEVALERAPPAAPLVEPPKQSVNPMAPPPAAAAAASSTAPVSDPSKVRHDWYQTQTHVVVSVLARNTPAENVSVDFAESDVSVCIKLDGGAEYQLNLSLYNKVWQRIRPARVASAVTGSSCVRELALRWSLQPSRRPLSTPFFR